MVAILRLFILLLCGVSSVYSFSAPPSRISSQATAPWQKVLESLFPAATSNTGTASNTNRQRNELKQKLVSICRENIGYNTPEIRQNIESIMDELSQLNPTPQTAISPKLRQTWILEWTSEKEINFFLEKGFSNEIIQTLTDDGILENNIPFTKGGSFGVTGEINVDEQISVRTNFKFKNAKLDIGRWGTYNFPPVGEGWFDTIYLDDELRIDTNSRDDILICSKG